MIKKIISLILLIIWVGIIWIFAFPKQTDWIASKLWLSDLVNNIRQVKSWADNTVRNSDKFMDKLWEKSDQLKKEAIKLKQEAENQTKNILK